MICFLFPPFDSFLSEPLWDFIDAVNGCRYSFCLLYTSALLDEQQQEKAAAAQIADAKTREQEALAELEKALAEARLRGRNEVLPDVYKRQSMRWSLAAGLHGSWVALLHASDVGDDASGDSLQTLHQHVEEDVYKRQLFILIFLFP